MRTGRAYWMHFSRQVAGLVFWAAAGSRLHDLLPSDEVVFIILLMVAGYLIYPGKRYGEDALEQAKAAERKGRK